MAFSDEYMVPIEEAQKLERDLAQSKEANAGLMRACDNLERELAESKKNGCDTCDAFTLANMQLREDVVNLAKQRDALAEALGSYVSHHRLRGFVTKSEILKAEQALAATKK